jgi:hypothetical protein
MLLDLQNLFMNNVAVTATAVSNAVDLRGGTPGFTTDTLGNTPIKDPGRSPELDVLITVTQTFTAAGAATLTVALVTDDDPALGSPTTLVTTPAIGKATLVQGYQIRIALPPGAPAVGSDGTYMGLSLTVATGPMTAGKLTAGLVPRDGRQTAPGSFV